MPARGTAALAPADVAPADENDDPARRAWADALLAATLLAVDPAGLKGAVVRSGAGPARDAWLDRFRAMAAADASFVDAPCAAPEDHLIGGLDLGATLHAGRPVAQAGLLQRADGGVLVLRMAERVAPGVAAAVASALDTGAVLVERHGLSERRPARFCLLALDEGAGPDEAAPPILKDRVAFAPALDGVSMRALTVADVDTAAVAAARARLDAVSVGEPVMEAMDDAARAFGVPGLRPLAFCVAAARAHAALHGRSEADAQDAAAACRLVLGPRATATPAPPDEAEAPPPDPPPPDPPPDQTDSGAQNDDEPLPEDLSLDRLIEIVAASVDATALARRGDAARLRAAASGKSGAKRAASGRGRPRGVRAGDPRRDGRLDIPATLRSAAPWSRLRRKPNDAVRVKVLPGDFQIKVTEERSESVVIFVVDASGSSAMHRMGEAKGAVENLLADCYARRDHVALIAFRRDDAELLLPPTRSLVRARRALVALPGGGGTPLAAALQAALALALSERSKGRTPLIVMLTDGKANVPLAGEGDREAARRDAARLARDILRERVAGLFFDTSPRGSDAARDLSAAMGADYVALPYADGARVAETVKRAVDAPRGPAG